MIRNILIVLIVFTMLSMTACDWFTSDEKKEKDNSRQLTIVNSIASTDKNITEVRLRTPSVTTSAESWGVDVLTSVLASGSSKTISIPDEFVAEGQVDVRALTQGGRELIRQNVYLPTGARLEFIDDEIVIYNNISTDDNVIERVHVWIYTGSSSPNEGPNLIQSTISVKDKQKIVLRTGLYKDVVYGLAFYTTSNRRFVRENQYLVHAQEVEVRGNALNIRNNIGTITEKQINQLHIKRVIDPETAWGINILTSNIPYQPTGNGYKVEVLFQIDPMSEYSIRATTMDGVKYLITNVRLLDNSNFVFETFHEVK